MRVEECESRRLEIEGMDLLVVMDGGFSSPVVERGMLGKRWEVT